MTHQDPASVGKRQEYVAIAELLRRDFDVYMTHVDDKQIDCVVRLYRRKPVYLDDQIKARSRTANHPGTFAAVKLNKPRPNYFFIFYSEAADQYWVMPSLDFVREANVSKSGANEGKYKIVFTNTRSNGDVVPRPRFNDFLNNFDLLEQFKG